MGALPPTRALATLAAAIITGAVACSGSGAEVLRDSETVIGRARADGQLVLLTTAPALLTIDERTRTITRTPIQRRSGEPKLWGLGEVGGILYSVAGFTDLMRLDRTGGVHHAARFTRAVGNLFDTPVSMAAQLAVDDVGMPLMFAVDVRAGMWGLKGPGRKPLGLSRAQEGVLQLLTCSAPALVACWLPGSNEPLLLDGNTLRFVRPLSSVASIEPVRLLARPAFRVIRDIVRTERQTLVVLFRDESSGNDGALAEFNEDGQLVRKIQTPEPLRLLLAARAGVLLAITESGVLIEVEL